MLIWPVQLLILILMLQIFGPTVRGILGAMLSPKSILPQCHHSVLHRPCPDHIASLHSPSPSFALGSISIPTFIYYLDPSAL